jgi:VWFA-related protein
VSAWLRPVCAVALVLSAMTTGSGPAATYASGQTQQTPQFRAATAAVVLDVSIVDRNGRPIPGLTADDIVILEDNEPRQIVSLDYVEMPDRVTTPAPWVRDVPIDVQHNQLADERLLVLLMDDTSTWGTAAIERGKAVAREFVDQMSQGDLAAVLFVGAGGRPQEFTSDRGRLLAAIDSFRYETARFGGLEALRNLSQALSAVPDRRKLVVYLSAGTEFDTDALSGAVNPEAASNASRIFRDVQAFIREAERANVNVYAVDLMGLLPSTADNHDPGRARREFMQVVASQTGGRSVVNSNNPTDAVPGILAENQSYYLIGFTPGPADTRDRFRRLTMRVEREGATVRMRRGYVQPGTNDPGSTIAATPTVPAWLPDSRIRLDLAAAPVTAGTDVTAVVTVGVSLPLPSALPPEGERERIAVRLEAFDQKDVSRAVHESAAQVTLRPDADQVFRLHVQFPVALAPGSYRLHVVTRALDRDVQGTLLGDLVVPAPASNTLQLSGLVLHTPTAPPSIPRDAVAALMPVVPTVIRTFSQDTPLLAWLRLSSTKPTTVTMQATIRDLTDTVVFQGTGIVATEAFTDGRADWQWVIPLKTLAPGEHLVTITATDVAGVAVTRTVRLHVQ